MDNVFVAPMLSARDSARKRAQNHFQAAEARTALVKQIVTAENAALDARSAKLKALRLAKEAEDAPNAGSAPTSANKSTRKIAHG